MNKKKVAVRTGSKARLVRKPATIRIAWTLDDGPAGKPTEDMMKVLDGKPATWYIQRHRVTSSTGELDAEMVKKLSLLQERGDEIAIHSYHPTIDHAAWFPANNCNSAPRAYETMEDSIRSLGSFTAQLRAQELRVTFVRLPTGLHSQMVCYLKHKGVKGDHDGIARTIIKGKRGSKDPGIAAVEKDYASLLAALRNEELLLWGGKSSGGVSNNSWEAESAYPGSGLTDNVTRVFKSMADKYVSSGNKPRSLVVLTHDTHTSYSKEVAKDIDEIETYAKSKGITIEYHTMSTLYAKIVGSTQSEP